MFVRIKPDSEAAPPVPAREAAREPVALSPQRRGRIVAGASAIFVRDGYEGASMAQIADAARVSKGTLYNYFPSKQALFEAFVRERCATLVENVFGEPDAAALLDLAAELGRIGRTMLSMMMSPDGRAIYRVVVMESSKFPELAKAFYNAGPRTMTDRMASWLARQIDAGTLRPHDPKFAAEQFFALTQARLLMQARTDATFVASAAEIDFVVDGAVAVFLAAYRATPSG
jgi:AcrR family transcriptional regulator